MHTEKFAFQGATRGPEPRQGSFLPFLGRRLVAEKHTIKKSHRIAKPESHLVVWKLSESADISESCLLLTHRNLF
jgi:hypothetical protein